MDDKRLRILEQVRRLYHRYGIKSVTMDDVAKQLCISKKTLYEYFADKEDLVKDVLMMDYQQRSTLFMEIEKKDLDAIGEILEVYKVINAMFRDYNTSMEYDIRKYYPDLYSNVKVVRRKRMYDTVYHNMNKGKREGFYRKDLDTKIIARLQVIRVENMFENEMFSLEELVSAKVFNEMFIYHMQGVLSAKGRIHFEKNFDRLRAGIA
ncbi:MAG: helix-turn-helix domain containing protein [Bacteroidetes bacterium]|nr:helix-turn-helix domain containing protein [Bacteroidota bacterium]